MNGISWITYAIAVLFACFHNVDCFGLFKDDTLTTPTIKTRSAIRTPEVIPMYQTPKWEPIIVTEQRRPNKQLRVICTESENVIKCYFISKGVSVQRFNEKTLWSTCILNFLYLTISRYL
ncbi:unnamed protein product [Heterobilharzia americana]|nr:unnamed protein product [Heterobilharzia americana]